MKLPKLLVKLSLFVLLGIMSTACAVKYKKREGKVYYLSYHGGSWTRHSALVEGADPKSFKAFKPYYDHGEMHAKDKNHAYWREFTIPGADPKTFKSLNHLYSVDDKHIYIRTEVLSTADPRSFRILNHMYALDADSVYYYDSHLYNHDGVISGADTKTFTYIGYGYARDKNSVYDGNHVREEVSDPATFTVLGKPGRYVENFWNDLMSILDDGDCWYLWQRDKNYYYRRGRRVEGADYATFSFFDDDGKSSYAKDCYHVWYCNCPYLYSHPFIVEGADMETFEVWGDSEWDYWAKDKNHYYEEGVAVDEERKQKLIELERKHYARK
jgi:hypothetical protein